MRTFVSRSAPSCRPVRRGTRPLAIVGTVALAATAAVATGASPAQAAGPAWSSGVFRGACNVDGTKQFGTWRGAAVAHVNQFLDGSSWSSLDSPVWLSDCWQGTGVAVTWSVPMLPSGSSYTIQHGASGAYDGYFRTLAQTLVGHGQAYATLRLGWEMNGGWFSWSAVRDPASYRAYWQHIVTAMRSVPGQHLRFDWSPNLGGAGFNPAEAYPGDGYVDIIGNSVYDSYWGGGVSAATRWSWLVDQPYGLQWQASFAAAHGKKLGFAEWGLLPPQAQNGGGGGDDPYFIQHMYDWFASHDTAYESYFEFDHNFTERSTMMSGSGTGPNFPNAAALYRRLWSGGSTATSTSTAPSVLVSHYADRSPAGALSGATVSGSVYVFVQPAAPATSVSFYLDDTAMSRTPDRVEHYAPYDLEGGTTAAANPFAAGSLSSGSHTLTVKVAYASGATHVSTVTFHA